jgi:hypothetical protein
MNRTQTHFCHFDPNAPSRSFLTERYLFSHFKPNANSFLSFRTERSEREKSHDRYTVSTLMRFPSWLIALIGEISQSLRYFEMTLCNNTARAMNRTQTLFSHCKPNAPSRSFLTERYLFSHFKPNAYLSRSFRTERSEREKSHEPTHPAPFGEISQSLRSFEMT